VELFDTISSTYAGLRAQTEQQPSEEEESRHQNIGSWSDSPIFFHESNDQEISPIPFLSTLNFSP
jgi:hypothetical protein